MRERRLQAIFNLRRHNFLCGYLANEACYRKVVDILKISEFAVTVQNKRLKYGMKTSTPVVLKPVSSSIAVCASSQQTLACNILLKKLY